MPTLDAEIQKSLYGRRAGGRIRVCAPEDRTADGIVFDSGHEMGVYLQFKSLVNAGTFREMRLQVPFPIFVTDPHGTKVEVFKWIADFVVIDRDGRESVYDAKAWDVKKEKFLYTDVYRLKKRAVEAQYGIRILEV